MKKALITGITGQDGSYLTELLLEKGYEVHGIVRRSSSFNTHRIDHLYNNPDIREKKLFFHHGDVTDASSINRILEKVIPDEIYNLAAQSHVMVSFEIPDYTAQVDALGTLRFLDAIRDMGLKQTKFYQASTSELFGRVQAIPQNEKTPFYPRSPYAVAKQYSYWIVVNYREAYGVNASNGILFNHESPRRGETFVTRKITRAVANIALGFQKDVKLGNLNAQRDWGHAKDYVESMYKILQHTEADDFVIATGQTQTVREFALKAFRRIGIELEFTGKDSAEQGIIANINSEIFVNRTGNLPTHLKQGDIVVKVTPEYFRPTEVDLLIGDATKAKNILGWMPKHTFDDVVNEMVESDILVMKRENGIY